MNHRAIRPIGSSDHLKTTPQAETDWKYIGTGKDFRIGTAELNLLYQR
jgi:hypothetical protein